jgi:hypothetical protein
VNSREKRFLTALRRKRVSHVWRGHGSALFLEFGGLLEQRSRSGRRLAPQGELSLMIEWSWRIESGRAILGGSWSAPRRWPKLFRRLVGSCVRSARVFGPLPEIAVSLTNGLRVVSFMTADGQPSWTILANRPALGTLGVRDGRLHVRGDASRADRGYGRQPPTMTNSS